MMSAPHRIQRQQTKGWRLPRNSVFVGGGSAWASPFKVGVTQVRMPALDGSPWELEARTRKVSGQQHPYFHPVVPGQKMRTTWHQVEFATAEQCVELYRHMISMTDLRVLRTELAGKNFVCWCPTGHPCHADILLELANPNGQPS